MFKTIMSLRKPIFLIIVLLIFPATSVSEDVAVTIESESESVVDLTDNPYIEYRIKTYDIQEDYLKSVSKHQQVIMHDMEYKLIQQRWQTTVIAIVVFIMIGIGLFLSYLQFKNDKDSETTPPITIKIGSGSIEITSTVIGLVILSLSFWFFQTYVDHVYNIEIFKIKLIDMTTFGVNH